MKIMVVDDEQDVQLLFEQKFRRETKAGQLELKFAHSGEDALAYLDGLDTSELRLLISDINMPGMSGLELLKKVKAKHRQLKVFMITAYGDSNNYQVAKDYGCDDYLTKPINFEELKQKLFKAD
jgi:two-component system, response regulator, stage 0 sporulation protein F